MSEVGEGHDIEHRSVDPMQCEGVRRDLHHHRPLALVDEGRETACRSGASGVVRMPWSVPIMPVDQPAASSSAATIWVVVVLPFVPGDPDEDQMLGWVTPCDRRCRADGQPRVLDDELHRVVHTAELMVDEQRRRTTFHGVGGELVAVECVTAQTGEHLPGRHRPRVVGEPAAPPPRDHRRSRRRCRRLAGARRRHRR